MLQSTTFGQFRGVIWVGRAIRGIAARLIAYEERRRQRIALAQLNDHLLDDIGVGRKAAQIEARRSCWR